MFLYLIFVYAHIIGIIAWIGYTLFWFLMVPPLSTEFEEREGDRLIKKIDNSNWPPDAIASPLRLKFHKLGWIILTVTIVTGLILLYLRGFGSFIVKKRAKKTARNISKNTTIIIPEHFIPSFKPAKSFVNKVKNNVKR